MDTLSLMIDIGVMTGFIRNGKKYEADSRLYKLYVLFWCKPYRIRILMKNSDATAYQPDTKEQLRSAYPMMVQQTHKSSNPASARRTMELIDRLMAAVPIYQLSCNMEHEAAKVAYEGMQG